MNHIFTKIIFATLMFALITIQVDAQKDTTEFEIGKKKLIVVDKKIQKENAIYNLEKGRESFKQEIINAEKTISEHQVLLEEAEVELNNIFKNLDQNLEVAKSDSSFSNIKNEELEKQKIAYEKQKLELEKQKVKVEKLKVAIEINEKKKHAFENGIKEIERGISEIESGLVEIDEELENLSDTGYTNTSTKNEQKKRFNAHWSGFEFGLLSFVNKNQSFVSDEEFSFMQIVPEKTFSYGLNIFELNIPFTKYSFGLATGAGLRWNSISLEQNVNLVENETGVIIGEFISAEREIKKNKLNVAYIRIPVVLEYQKPIKKQKLYIGLGLFVEIRGWSKQRQKYVINEVTFKDKKVDNFQLSPFTYGVSARAGYGDIGFFVEYSLVPLFKVDKGPEMYPVMIGIRLVDF